MRASCTPVVTMGIRLCACHGVLSRGAARYREDGGVEVTISSGSSSNVIGTVHTGEICGKVSLLSVRPHFATAKAVNDIEVAELHRRDLRISFGVVRISA